MSFHLCVRKQVSKVIWQESARLLVTPHSGECIHLPCALGRHICLWYVHYNWQWPVYVPPQKCPFSWGSEFQYPCTHLSQAESSPQMASESVQPYLICTAYPFSQHTDTDQWDHATCNICSNRPHLCTACRRCRLKVGLKNKSEKLLASVVSRRTGDYGCDNAAGCVKCSGSGQQFFSEQLAAVTLNLEGIHVVSIVSYWYVVCAEL